MFHLVDDTQSPSFTRPGSWSAGLFLLFFGVVTTYTHDAATRRLATLTSKLSPVSGGTTFQALTYGYDKVGNVESLTNALPSAVSTPFGGAVSYVYGYDELNRLTSATGKAASRPGVDDTFVAGWKYSDIHNLERATLARQVTSMTGTERPPGETRDEAYLYQAAHPHQARSIGTLQLEYDDDGNTIRECEGTNCPPGRGRTYAWDEEGRMEEANAKGRLVRFRYDADGQRMVKLAAGGPTFTFGQWWTMSGNSHATKHVFAGAGRVATKMLPAATVQANTPPGGMPGTGWPNTNGCVPSGNQPQKCPTNSNGTAWVERGVARPATWYYHSDSLGSTQWLTDDAGKLHERVEYYPYGEVWRQSSGQGVNKLRQAFLYTGKEYDSETGLTYFGARYYDSRRARWLSVDPLFVTSGRPPPGGLLSVYSYGSNSPQTWVDPDGRCGIRSDNTVDCLGPVWAQHNDVAAATDSAFRTGDYGSAAVGSALGVASAGLVVAGLFLQGTVGGAYNSGYNAASGFIEGDYDRALEGSVGLLAIGLMKRWEAQFAPRPLPTTVAAEAGDHVVLGLRNYGLEGTAGKVGGRTLLSDPNWKSSLLNAVADPRTKLTVSLDGLSGASASEKVMRGVQQGVRPDATPMNWELMQIYKAGRLKDVTFLEAGTPVSNPFQ